MLLVWAAFRRKGKVTGSSDWPPVSAIYACLKRKLGGSCTGAKRFAAHRVSIAAVFVHNGLIMYASSLYTALSIYQLRHIVYTSRHVNNMNERTCAFFMLYGTCILYSPCRVGREASSVLHREVNFNLRFNGNCNTAAETVLSALVLLYWNGEQLHLAQGSQAMCVFSSVDSNHARRWRTFWNNLDTRWQLAGITFAIYPIKIVTLV